MKRLQLWLLSAFLCCASFGQSANDHIGRINISLNKNTRVFKKKRRKNVKNEQKFDRIKNDMKEL